MRDACQNRADLLLTISSASIGTVVRSTRDAHFLTVKFRTMKGVISQRLLLPTRRRSLFARLGDEVWKHPWWFVLFIFLSFGHTLSAQAQAPCTFTCPTTDPASPLTLFAGTSCNVLFKPSNLSVIANSCPDPIELRVIKDGVTLGTGLDSVSVNMTPHLGDIFWIEVRYGSSLFCTIWARVLDVTGPQLTCRDTILPCTGNTSPLALGFPTAAENCDPGYSISFVDNVRINSCDSLYPTVITRTWTAVDGSNNIGTCVQTIRLTRPVLTQIAFPRDTVLDCAATSTGPDATGYPTWQNGMFSSQSLCAFSVTYTDQVIQNPGSNGICRTIRRTWRVLNVCTALDTIGPIQTIQVVDTTRPTIVCPAAKNVRTTIGKCTAIVYLDNPIIGDNCDPDVFFTVATSYGSVGTGPHSDVALGTHSATYTAWDGCGNSRSCTTTVTVVDDERPIAICDDELVISLNETGTAVASAKNFNEGSRDNCVQNLYYKIRRMTTGGCNNINGDDSAVTAGIQEWFDDNVYFCCEDVSATGVTIPVILRVYTVNPGAGPVNPAREIPGGDLFGKYNECMSMVRVKDPILPQVYCPNNTVAECTADLTNTAQFGSPVVLANCGYNLDSLEISNIDNCGRGTITRTFTASKPGSLLKASCTQTVTVQNNQNLRSADIVWPKNITIEICGASTEPHNLPSGYQQPDILRQPACGLSAVSYQDQFYDAAQPACFKVYRTWTVIDWCVFDPSVSATAGKFQFTQVIDVQDHTPPSFVCPADIVVPAATGCQSAQVLMPALVATDCSPTLRIVNNSPFAAAPGANISGTYPLGTTSVKYTITDGCGNVASCAVRVTVVDQKGPGVICIKGLSTSIAQMPAGVMAMVDAKAFDAGTTDNCTEKTDIKFTIRKAIGSVLTAPTATQLTFDCADIGEVPVELWATDESGNSSACITTIRITDNNNLCPPDIGQGTVAGAIITETGNDVEYVKIHIKSDKEVLLSTGADGAFQQGNLPFGYDYIIEPKRNDDLMNGVSTIDLIRLTKHVLGVQPFTSPYQYIAADLDKSGSISTLDLIKLRKLILGKDTELSNGNTSWRFVDAAFRFPEGVNPLQTGFPESKSFKNFKTKGAEANFIAVKIGDINGSAIPNSLIKSESRATGGDLILRVKNQQFKYGEEMVVDVVADELKNVNGYQFTLDFDERLIDLKEMRFGDFLTMTEDNFGFSGLDKGRIATSWTKSDEKITEGSVILFSMVFSGKQSADLLTALGLSNQPTNPEAYNKEGELMQILLNIEGEDGEVQTEGRYELFQNFPNPFSDRTTIGFILPNEMEASLKVFDMAGRLVYQRSGQFPKGYSEITVNYSYLNGSGMYFYQFATDEFTATRKMTLTGGQ